MSTVRGNILEIQLRIFSTVGGPGPNSIRPRLRSKSAKDLVVQEPFAWSLLRGEFKKRHKTTIEQQRSALIKSTDRARRERYVQHLSVPLIPLISRQAYKICKTM